VESGANLNLERASRNIAGVTLVPPTGLEPYDLLRHEHVMLSRDAVAKLSRSLSATRAEVPVQIEPAPAAATKKSASEKGADEKATAKHAAAKTEKSSKKPAAKKEAKAKAKPKGKKG
jgi:hypothetical protein